MNKVFKRITGFILITYTVLYGSCQSLRLQREHFDRRSIFSLLPLHNEEYIPPIPVHFRNSHGFGKNLPRPSRSQNKDTELDHRPWIPVQHSQGVGTVRREVFQRPSTNKRRFPLKVVTTQQPTSFDIPLQKSIKVSHADTVNPAIQTTGYIRDISLRELLKPKLVDGQQGKRLETLREVTSPSSVNHTIAREKWTPKRIISNIPHGNGKNVAKNIEIKFPHSLNTRFDKHLNYTGIRFGSNVDSEFQPSTNTSTAFNDDSEFSKYINDNLKAYDTFFLQPVDQNNFTKHLNPTASLRDNNDNDKLEKIPRKPKTSSSDKKKSKNLSEIFPTIGIEYAENEDITTTTISPIVHNDYNNDKEQKKTITLFAGGQVVSQVPRNSSKKVNETKRHDKESTKKTTDKLNKQFNSPLIEDVAPLTVQNGKFNDFSDLASQNKTSERENPLNLKPESVKSKEYERTSSTEDSNIFVQKPRSEIFHDSEQHNNNPDQKLGAKEITGIKFPEVIGGKIKYKDSPDNVHGLPFSKTPFFEPKKEHIRDSSREIKHDDVYFPPIFPDTPWIAKSPPLTAKKEPVKNLHDDFILLNTSEKVSVSSFSPDKERLVEVNPKRSSWNENKISDENRDTVYDLKKPEIFNDHPSLGHRFPTPPSLITVSPRESVTVTHVRLNFDTKQHNGNKNSTNNYVLERKPSLLPDLPGSSRPRKPNIRLSSGMLAGILIAALIFLGFLTGTIVFAVHQYKFHSTRSKSKERQKKRVTNFTPEYIDETFAGNTYIHNNIFLPTSQNMEDRDSPELDTSFSVDSEETMPMPNHPSTSSNQRNNPIRTHTRQNGGE